MVHYSPRIVLGTFPMKLCSGARMADGFFYVPWASIHYIITKASRTTRQFWHGASRSEARIPPGPFLGGASMKGFWDSLGIKRAYVSCWLLVKKVFLKKIGYVSICCFVHEPQGIFAVFFRCPVQGGNRGFLQCI